MKGIGRYRVGVGLRVLFALTILITALSGCSLRDTQVNNIEIISKELVEIPGQNSNIRIYKLFYRSDNIKVLAYLTVPKARGKYPLVVSLHGGYAWERKELSHYNYGFTLGFKYFSDQVVGLFPLYRGYMESDGHVQGIAENTRDTENAIQAAKSTGRVKPNSIYLLGSSMGGGVALRLASERQDVQAVVAISPFVGWDATTRWLDEHPDVTSPAIVEEQRELSYYVRFRYINGHEESKGDYAILDRIPEIQAPVLLLQGTGDQNLIWQTVQLFADEMEKVGKTVKLVVYPNGQHGLEDKYIEQRNQEIVQWLQQYGGPKPFIVE
ncbi:alpha/beta fold hydrolase [Paenibacillus timonensis]|nr:alpha/beta fold hydrolase [Paenibacillus timonensis]MUG88864.1 alpha/beta fold hydrolase [Paenibacillus timonensis]